MNSIANILREAADKIEAVCDADKVSAAPLPELPSEPALPEPVKRREWDASVSCGGSFLGSLGEYQESIRVREVLPGDPTMEEVQALVDACQGWANIPHHEAIKTALQPFTSQP